MSKQPQLVTQIPIKGGPAKYSPELPNETWIQILKYVDFRSICRFGTTNRRNCTTSLDASVWKALCVANRVQIDPVDCSVRGASSANNVVITPLSFDLLTNQNTCNAPADGLDKMTINYKYHFAIHRRRVLERMKQSRAYWSEYQSLQRIVKVASAEDERAETLRKLLSTQFLLPSIPCIQCEAEKSLAAASSKRPFLFHQSRDSNVTLTGELPDSDSDSIDSVSPPGSYPTSLQATSPLRLHTSSLAFQSSPNKIILTHMQSNASPRSSLIHHTLTSGCSLAEGLQDLVPRDRVIQTLVGMDAAASRGGEGGLQFLRQPVAEASSSLELSSITKAIRQARLNSSTGCSTRLFHSTGI
ncbi:hypothetical protein BC830DRAFT_1103103 [Chytriomyces sp. MP71]|nr:hypothetical protein BC830DRAFT_1103103 [Chytriomyces sp. MP71]